MTIVTDEYEEDLMMIRMMMIVLVIVIVTIMIPIVETLVGIVTDVSAVHELKAEPSGNNDVNDDSS